MTDQRDKGIGNHILKYWVVYITLITLAGSWATITFRITALEARTTKMEEYRESEQITLIQMQKDIASINTSIIYIRESLQNK